MLQLKHLLERAGGKQWRGTQGTSCHRWNPCVWWHPRHSTENMSNSMAAKTRESYLQSWPSPRRMENFFWPGYDERRLNRIQEVRNEVPHLDIPNDLGWCRSFGGTIGHAIGLTSRCSILIDDNVKKQTCVDLRKTDGILFKDMMITMYSFNKGVTGTWKVRHRG